MQNKFAFDQNYPNPFNPTTTIKYSVPESAGFVSLKVFDVLGKRSCNLVNEQKQPGNYEISIYCRKLSSGIYYYTMKVNGNMITKKMILLK
ncbi:MAG: T9SS type A sorting domain-containing protein [Ignavibacteriales bacterium]|nr:T9SS type A sorting domain-containing protein [Ignavibacteriales bacterium]